MVYKRQQQQRVAVARALVFDPKLVLMDEPLSALDKQLREQLQYEIKRLHHELGLTVVYVTHDQTEAMAMSDRVAVFHQGRIQQIDAPTTLYEQPANAFVAQFIGENNQLQGRIVSIDRERCNVVLDDGSTVVAQPVGSLKAGDPTWLSVRPERIHLNPTSADHTTRVQGMVIDVTYLGRHARVRLKACGLEDFIVTLPNDGRDLALASGSALTLGWRAVDCRALVRE
ncbi:MAG: ABC transporter ATP-binding protein, partial [Rhodoferax sp.]|nr:ABC transporter ATP-binding protein [Rhodoferax sp.]